jgi:hypothetical protein
MRSAAAERDERIRQAGEREREREREREKEEESRASELSKRLLAFCLHETCAQLVRGNNLNYKNMLCFLAV